MSKIHHTERIRVLHDRSMQPEDWKRFVEFPYFTRKWKSLDLDDEALRALELMLVAHPTLGPLIAGTGGLRKVRFARAGQERGADLGLGTAISRSSASYA